MFLALAFALAAPPAVPFGKLASVAPEAWTSEKPLTRLRSHQFQLAGVDGSPGGEVIVMPESSPKVDKEFPRWKAQYTPPEGKTVEDIAKESKFEIGAATVQLLDVSGTWKYRERPFDPKSKEERREGYRTVWAIVVVKDESTHVRLSGPVKVVEREYAGFEKWLRGLK